MKKLALFLGILLIGIGCNSGTSSEKKEETRASKIISKMNTICQLTSDQSARLQPIVENFIKTKIDNRDKYASDQTALRKADSTNRTNYVDSLRKILTPDQFEKLKSARKMNKQDGKGGDNGGEQE
jgi:predicted component of type VI protein secretion system